MGERQFIMPSVDCGRLPLGSGFITTGVDAAELISKLNELVAFENAGDVVAEQLARPGVTKVRFYGIGENGERVLALVNPRGVWVFHGPDTPACVTWEWAVSTYGAEPSAPPPGEPGERWDGMS